MKKMIRQSVSAILCLLMLAASVSLLAACRQKVDIAGLTGDARADAILDLYNKEADNCTLEEKEVYIGTMYGSRTEAEIYSTVYRVGLNSKSPVIYSESDLLTKMVSGNLTTTSEGKQVQGFADGKVFSMRRDDGDSVALVSDITYEEYTAHRDSLLLHTEEEYLAAVKSASKKTAAETDDGGWMTEFSGYSQENLDILIESRFQMMVYLFEGYHPSDMKLTAKIDQKQNPVSMDFVLVYEKDADAGKDDIAPTVTISMTKKDIGKTKALVPNLSEYTEVEDFRPLSTAQKALHDMDYGDRTELFSRTNTTVRFGAQGETGSMTYALTVENKDGYAFNLIETQMAGTADEFKYTVAYADGKCTVSGKGIPTQSSTMTLAEAQASTGLILDPAGLTSALVSSVQKGDGKEYDYIFTIHNPDYEQYKAAYDPIGATNYRSSGTVSVKMEDGKITAYRYDFKLTADVEGQTMTLNNVTTIYFGTTEDPGAAA